MAKNADINCIRKKYFIVVIISSVEYFKLLEFFLQFVKHQLKENV